MSAPIIIVLVIESALVGYTTLILIKPTLLFHSQGNKQSMLYRFLARLSGVFMLCVTFCWSIVVGLVMALQ